MGIQSAVMAKQFGENFQYGKRRISAMSNEEFNKLTPQKLQENANSELRSMIPSMEQSVTDMRAFQTFLIQEFILMVQSSLAGGLDAISHSLGIKEHMFPHQGAPVPTPVPIPPPQNVPPPPKVGETPQPPVSIPQPKSPRIEPSKATILLHAIGKVTQTVPNVRRTRVYTAWSAVPNSKPKKYFKNGNTGNTLTQIRAKVDKFWPRDKYQNMLIGTTFYYYLRSLT